jgi:hypothetical protein
LAKAQVEYEEELNGFDKRLRNYILEQKKEILEKI